MNMCLRQVSFDHFLIHKIACNSPCKTCMYYDDFTMGDPDYCTSCDAYSMPILDLTGAKPTCVSEPPANSAILVVRNNRMLGVYDEASAYGGESMDGSNTYDMDPDYYKMEDLTDEDKAWYEAEWGSYDYDYDNETDMPMNETETPMNYTETPENSTEMPMNYTDMMNDYYTMMEGPSGFDMPMENMTEEEMHEYNMCKFYLVC